MKSRNLLRVGASALAVAGLFLAASGASADPNYRPYKYGITPIDPSLPIPHVGPYTGQYVAPLTSRSGKWKYVGNLPFTSGPWNAKLLTDGTVLVDDSCTSQWYKLTPDGKGKYEDGTWSVIAAMPSGYSPLYFASQVLPDGRLIMNGGEYNGSGCIAVWTKLGALYDPVKNKWTSVAAPTGWGSIGDAESVLLPDGTYMLADCCDSSQALASISGTTVTWTAQTGYGNNDEEAFTPLPNGDVLLVDVWKTGSNYDDYEIYDTAAGTWSLAGQTPDLLTTSAKELGPAPLTPIYGRRGTIIQFSANSSSGVSDIYDIASGTWASGPVMEVAGTIYDCADAPAATLPDGNVLVQASPGVYKSPSHFWEFTISKLGQVTATQVDDPKGASNDPSYAGSFVMLPTGQALWDDFTLVATYTPKGRPKGKWLPVVSSVSSTLTVGSSGNAISGTNFNGFSLGASYGDDGQMSTNFPLVRITNNTTGDVCFGRSYNFSTMGVWTRGTTSAEFDIPASCETGASTLQVVVNGIASAGTAVTLS
ncbi:MAG TPA: hypothetical protein VHT03_04450 [Rhizomicrobium sp.]|jgi:hypothetical protein|nr:hypothetical protein [Rhizomicrobium sp.]